MIKTIVIQIQEDQTRDELQVMDLLDEVMLETQETETRFLGEDRNAMQSSPVKIDPVWILGSLLLTPLHSDRFFLVGESVVEILQRIFGGHDDGDSLV